MSGKKLELFGTISFELKVAQAAHGRVTRLDERGLELIVPWWRGQVDEKSQLCPALHHADVVSQMIYEYLQRRGSQQVTVSTPNSQHGKK
jgi:hypothetical protein